MFADNRSDHMCNSVGLDREIPSLSNTQQTIILQDITKNKEVDVTLTSPDSNRTLNDRTLITPSACCGEKDIGPSFRSPERLTIDLKEMFSPSPKTVLVRDEPPIFLSISQDHIPFKSQGKSEFDVEHFHLKFFPEDRPAMSRNTFGALAPRLHRSKTCRKSTRADLRLPTLDGDSTLSRKWNSDDMLRLSIPQL